MYLHTRAAWRPRRYGLFAALSTLLGGAAHATSVTYSPLDLARGELYLEDAEFEDDDSATLAIPGVPGACMLTASGGALFSNGPATCPGLWGMTDIKAFRATLTAGGEAILVDFTPQLAPQTKAFTLSGDDVVIPAGVPELFEVAILRWEGSTTAPKPAAWETVMVEDGKIPLGQPTATVARNAGGRFLIVGFDADADDLQPLSWQVLATPTATTPTATTPTTVTPPLPPPRTGSVTIAAHPIAPEGYTVELDQPPADISGFALQAMPPGEPIPPELACPPSAPPQRK